jgi:hypothetical protein
MDNCPVCQGRADHLLKAPGRFARVSCPGCGDFNVSQDVQFALVEMARERVLVSHWLRLASEAKNYSGQEIDLTFDLFQAIITGNKLPSIPKQKDNLLHWLGDELNRRGQLHEQIPLTEYRKVAALIGAAPEPGGGLMYIVRLLCEAGLVRARPLPPSQYSEPLGLTDKGWERYQELTRERPGAAPYSARELPMAIDFLNSVWEKRFGRPLISLRRAEITIGLALGCANPEDLKARLTDLGEALRWIAVDDDLLPGDTLVHRREKLNRLRECLRAKIDPNQQEELTRVIDVLRDINEVRNCLTHKGSPKLVAALARLEIEYPPLDYGAAWDKIRAKAAEALSTIRGLVSSVDQSWRIPTESGIPNGSERSD